MNARALALRLLSEWEEKKGFANLVLSDRALAQAGKDAAFLTALFYGTVERKLTLDYFIGALSARAEHDVTPEARNILRLGLYQLVFMKLPPYAAVAETASLSKKRSERGFINAVLRRAAEMREQMPLPPEEKTVRHLSVKHSFPQKTVKHFLSMYGKEDAEALFTYYNTVAPLSLTARDEETRDWLLCRFREDGIAAQAARYARRGIRVLTPVSPTALYGFGEGLFFVQDEASALASEALSPCAGDTVVDACAAPGGKTFGAALWAKGEGRFYAFDLHESKLSLIRDGADRLHLPITVRAVDATVGEQALFGQADRVICDVPCSGLGVLGKKPDLRYREENGALPALQYEILCTSARYLKDGGVLLYSTCTLRKEENEENVLRFLKEHEDFTAEDFSLGAGKELSSEGGMLTLLPHRHGCDGFFLCRLKKTKKKE